MLNDAVLLQCSAEVKSLTSALCLSVLKEPVDQLAAGEGAMIRNAVLLSQLHEGVFVCDETGDTETKELITCDYDSRSRGIRVFRSLFFMQESSGAGLRDYLSRKKTAQISRKQHM